MATVTIEANADPKVIGYDHQGVCSRGREHIGMVTMQSSCPGVVEAPFLKPVGPIDWRFCGEF